MERYSKKLKEGSLSWVNFFIFEDRDRSLLSALAYPTDELNKLLIELDEYLHTKFTLEHKQSFKKVIDAIKEYSKECELLGKQIKKFDK